MKRLAPLAILAGLVMSTPAEAGCLRARAWRIATAPFRLLVRGRCCQAAPVAAATCTAAAWSPATPPPLPPAP